MGGRRYDAAHRRARIAALRQLVDGTPCPLCRRPMTHQQALDLDHVTAVTVGWDDPRHRLTHAGCNRAAGARLGAELRRVRRRASREQLILC